MFKFIRLTTCLFGLFSFNSNIIIAQSGHQNIETLVTYEIDDSQKASSIPITLYDKNNNIIQNNSSFNLDLGIGKLHGEGTYQAINGSTSDLCSYSLNKTFSGIPYTVNYYYFNTTAPQNCYYCSCDEAFVTLNVDVNRINNNLTCPTLVAFDHNLSFDSQNVNFDNSLREYLHIEIYDNVNCTGTALASFNLEEGVSSFKLTDLPGQVSTSVYQSLTNKTSYLKVTYLSALYTYTSNSFRVCPVFFADRVNLSSSTFSSNPVSCHGGTNGGVKIDQIVLKSGRVTTIKDTLRFTIKKFVSGKWISMVPTDYSTFYNSTNYNASAISPLPAGYYSFVVWGNLIGGDSISGPTYLKITEPTLLSYTLSTTQPVCSTDKGSVTVLPTGGNGGYTVTVNGSPQTSEFTFYNLSPNTYPVLVTDSKSCLAYSPSAVIDPGWDPTITTNLGQPACLQNKNGRITFNVNGTLHDTAQTGYTYYLNNTPSTYPFTGLAPGKYAVRLTDNRGCPSKPISDATLDYDTSNDPVISFAPSGITQPKCTEQPGNIKVAATKGHGTPTYTYKCTGKADVPGQGSSYTFPGLQAGTVYLSVTDALGCPCRTPISATLSNTNILSVSGSPEVKQKVGSTDYHLICNGDAFGTISVTANTTPPSSIPDNRYQLFDVNNMEIKDKFTGSTKEFNNLIAGTYAIKITDVDNCTKTSTPITLVAPPKVTITPSLVTATDVICYGESNGTITIGEVKGGIGAYSYSFDNGVKFSGNTGDNIKSNCSATTYHLMAKDSKECLSDVVDKTVKQPTLLSVPIHPENHTGYNVNCNSDFGTATAQPNGGVGGYSYVWDNIGNSTTQTVNNLTPDINYHVTVTDLNNCTASDSITLTQPEPLRIKNATPVDLKCYGDNSGEIIVETKGGVSNQTVILKLGNDTVAKFKGKAVGETSHFTGLAKGTYDVILSDNNGCSDHKTATLLEPDTLTVDLVPSTYVFYYNIKCHGTSDTIRTDISGGTTPYDITWNDNGKYAIKTNAIAGPTYSVDIQDAHKCKASASIQLTEPDTLKIVRKDRTLPTCVYSNNGNATIHATGGVLPYTFSLDTAEKTPVDTFANFTSLFHNPNGYPITIHDTYNCIITDTLILRDRPILKINDPFVTIPKCYGGNNGTILLSGVGGQTTNGIYEFHIIDDNITRIENGTTVVFDTIRAGNYTTVIIDDLNCRDTTTSIVDDAVAITYTTKIDTNRCFNDHTARLTIKATSGYGLFKFGYRFGTDTLDYTSRGDSTLVLSRLNWNQDNISTPLTYHIYIRDANYTAGQPSCSVHDSVVLPMVKKMSLQINSFPISCLGANDGAMAVGQTVNAQGTVSYSWLGPKDGIESVTTDTISGLAPGTYIVTVKDTHSCEFSESRSFTNPQPMSDTVIYTVAESGANMNDGKAFFEVTGTRDTISYWIDGGLTQTAILDNSTFHVEPLAPGSHTIAIANPSNSSCRISTPFTIKHQSPFLTRIGKRNATFGSADGMISVIASGGAGGYSYIWLNQAGDTLKQYTTSVTSTLSKGIYSVVAMDGEGNVSNTVTDTIIESDKLSIALMSSTSPTCHLAANGVARVSAGGGYRPYTYGWVDAHGVTVSSDSLASGLLQGSYTASVKDSRGTRVSIIVPLVASDSIKDINLLVAQPSCHNQASGQIQVSSIQGGSGSYSYLWSTGATSKNLENIASGSYTVTVFDNAAAGQVCSFTKPVVISGGPATLALHTDSVVSPVCYGGADGKIYVSALGGTAPYTIAWPGTTAKGAAYYNAVAGKHAVRVTDAHGCQTSDTILVENPLPLMFDQTLSHPKCVGDNNGSIALTMLNGRPSYYVKWTPELHTNSLQVTVPAGAYNAEITDANGCKINGAFTILSPKPLKVDSFLVVTPGCSNTANGALTAQVSGGTAPYVYKWSNYQKGQTASALAGGKYSVTVTDNNLCQASGQVELTTPAPVTFAMDVQEPSCSGYDDGSIMVTPQGGTGAYSCTLNSLPSELTIPGLYAGRYNIVVKDDHNCTAAKTVLMSEPTPMVAVESILSTITCANLCNGQAKLDVSGSFAPYSASWDDSGSGLERNDLCAGTFQVQITDSHGCQVSKFVSMEQPDAITLDNIAVVNPTCAGGSDGSAEIICSGGTQPYSISWDNGQSGNTVKELKAAKYVVTIADANNCSISQDIAVEDPAKETIAAFPSEFKLCEGQQNIINPGVWASYTWYLDNTRVSDTSRFNANQTGHYKLHVVSEKGCTDSTEFNVQVSKDLLSAKFLIPNDVITDDTVEIVDVSWPVPDSISWHIDSQNARVIKQLSDRQQIVFKEAGEYAIRLVAHKSLCVAENEQVITVYNSTGEKIDGKQPIKPPSDIEELYLFPNPSNGSFTVRIKLSGISKVNLKIVRLADNTVIAVKESENSDLYEVPFELPGILPGVYMLNLQTDTAQKMVKFVVMN